MIRRKYAYMRIYDYNIDFEDIENTITYSLSAENLENNLNKREEELCNKISDLETKLAESEKQNKELYNEKESAERILRMSSNEQTREIKRLQNELSAKVDYIHELVEVKDDYKQQLAEKEKELENYKLCKCVNCTNEYEFMLEGLVEDLERELDKADQDKISFAVEQLEQVRKLVDELLDNCGDKQYKVWEVFDNQIKQLKEMK